MRKAQGVILLLAFLSGFSFSLPAQKQTNRKDIYHHGWIDLNKNGRMDVYESRNSTRASRNSLFRASSPLERSGSSRYRSRFCTAIATGVCASVLSRLA